MGNPLGYLNINDQSEAIPVLGRNVGPTTDVQMKLYVYTRK